jgi:hypothetical protein
MDKNKPLLPWYINRTLPERERDAVEVWLQRDPDAKTHYQETQQLAQIVQSQVKKTPHDHTRTSLLLQIRQQPIRSDIGIHPWFWATPLMLLIFSILWLIVQPGTQLRWSTSGNMPAAFRIYRAPAGSQSYQLLKEITVNSLQYRYQFTDRTAVLPGQTYNYVIEAIGNNGGKSISPIVSSNTLEVFTAHLALLLTSLILTFCTITIVQEITPFKLSHFVVKII